ncbi:hypothetical protein [Massilia sp. ST3]|uniref:hypothetical protein n=1 Tax=Massilia sp. ST3 TaxID=2824903 RepID=UPI001B83B8C3|nr:hypothetical protein [Massilia sp. ST3]MBQ5947530.1 hypothetical protein [Massilia sp. ST3]
MVLNSLLFRYISGLILAIAAAHSSAGPMPLVQVSGEIAFGGYTGTGGFEQYDDRDHVERGSFTLIYDPLIPDTDHDNNRGLFRGAIRSFVMSVSQVNRPGLSFSLVGRGDLHRSNGDWVSWEMTLEEENDVFEPSMFWFGMYQQNSGNSNEMPTIEFWSKTLVGLGGGGAGVNETDWLDSRTLTAGTIPRPVPVPPSLWLLAIGAAAGLLQQKRLRKS